MLRSDDGTEAIARLNADLRRSTRPTYWLTGGLIGGAGMGVLGAVVGAGMCADDDTERSTGTCMLAGVAGAAIAGGVGFTVGTLIGGLFPKAETAVPAEACVLDSSWTAPQSPFRIHGNTWHVGPRGLGVFLVTAPTGHVLIDGGVPANAALIEANIRGLGIDLRDVRWILSSHAHCDHAGGIARLARDTGAEVIASVAGAEALARGGRDDPQYGDALPFPPVRVTRTVADGERLVLGGLELTAHVTPGHTKGNTTWAWTSCEGSRCLRIVDVGSLSAPEYRLIDNPNYPDVVADFERSFATVAALPCDIALAPHPGMVDFWERAARREQGDAGALVVPARCRAYAAAARTSFEAELARQRQAAAGQRRP